MPTHSQRANPCLRERSFLCLFVLRFWGRVWLCNPTSHVDDGAVWGAGSRGVSVVSSTHGCWSLFRHQELCRFDMRDGSSAGKREASKPTNSPAVSLCSCAVILWVRPGFVQIGWTAAAHVSRVLRFLHILHQPCALWGAACFAMHPDVLIPSVYGCRCMPSLVPWFLCASQGFAAACASTGCC
jgi:hypothetical protein